MSANHAPSFVSGHTTAPFRIHFKWRRERNERHNTYEDYSIFRQSLSDEENNVSEQLAEVASQIEDCRKRCGNIEEQKALIEKYPHFDKLDRSVADEFIDFVEIGMTGENGEREIHIH